MTTTTRHEAHSGPSATNYHAAPSSAIEGDTTESDGNSHTPSTDPQPATPTFLCSKHSNEHGGSTHGVASAHTAGCKQCVADSSRRWRLRHPFKTVWLGFVRRAYRKFGKAQLAPLDMRWKATGARALAAAINRTGRLGGQECTAEMLTRAESNTRRLGITGINEGANSRYAAAVLACSASNTSQQESKCLDSDMAAGTGAQGSSSDMNTGSDADADQQSNAGVKAKQAGAHRALHAQLIRHDPGAGRLGMSSSNSDGGGGLVKLMGMPRVLSVSESNIAPQDGKCTDSDMEAGAGAQGSSTALLSDSESSCDPQSNVSSDHASPRSRPDSSTAFLDTTSTHGGGPVLGLEQLAGVPWVLTWPGNAEELNVSQLVLLERGEALHRSRNLKPKAAKESHVEHTI